MTISRTCRLLVAAVAGVSVTVAAVPPASAAAAVTIDTYDDWDGSAYTFESGHPDTSTYGQVLTAPAGTRKMTCSSCWISSNEASGTMVVRGEISTWDGAKAGKEVWESNRWRLDLDGSDPTFNRVRVKTLGADLEPGKQHVVFLTVSKNYEETDPGLTSRWAFVGSDVLEGGDGVFLNDAGDESLWTTQNWVTLTGNDFAIRAKFQQSKVAGST